MLPKAIVLTTVPNKLPLNRNNINYSMKSSPDGCKVSILMDSQVKTKDCNSSAEEDISPAPIRKRQRLDHLTNEEKMLRRKLKNRVAAQCARDRKKARMSSLEDQVLTLENEKEELLRQNLILKQYNEKLEKENLELKKKLEENSVKQSEQLRNVCVKKEDDDCGSLEHAEGSGSAVSYSLDEAIRMLADDCEPNDFFDLLQQCDEEFLQNSIISSTSENETTDSEINTEERSNDKMVGTTSTELESIKELIEFDHVYYKHENGENPTSNQQVISTESTTDGTECLPLIYKCSVDLSKKNVNEFQREPEEKSLTTVDTDILIPSIVIKQEYKDIPNPMSPLSSIEVLSGHSPSPSLSDSGYESVNSPLSEVGTFLEEPWADTFTELFPSLV